MKYYFGKVSQQDVHAFGTDNLFEHEGEYFYNQLEIGSNPGGIEDFVISDTCGRSIPLATEQIPQLVRVLVDISLTMNSLTEAEALQDDLANSNIVVTF